MKQPLTVAQRAALDDFVSEMENVVIPRIVADVRERQRSAEVSRHRVINSGETS